MAAGSRDEPCRPRHRPVRWAADDGRAAAADGDRGGRRCARAAVGPRRRPDRGVGRRRTRDADPDLIADRDHGALAERLAVTLDVAIRLRLPAPAEIEDGRHFVFVTDADRPEDGAATVTFDLAYFLTGAEGEQAAAEHGDEFVNGYYIVNDNPRLRTVPLADHVRVRYIPTGMCCELQPGNLDAWLESILETNPTDYDGKDVPWWITVRAGTITRIQQQYLP
jgi:hypothetical protein